MTGVPAQVPFDGLFAPDEVLHRPGMEVFKSGEHGADPCPQCIICVRALGQHGEEALHEEVDRNLLLRDCCKGFDPRQERRRPAPVLRISREDPRRAFISTDCASSSRLCPVAIAVAPAARAASVSAFLRRMPQIVQACASRPASRVSRSSPMRSQKETMRCSTPSRPVRVSAARMVSARYPAMPSSTVMQRDLHPAMRAGAGRGSRGARCCPFPRLIRPRSGRLHGSARLFPDG